MMEMASVKVVGLRASLPVQNSASKHLGGARLATNTSPKLMTSLAAGGRVRCESSTGGGGKGPLTDAKRAVDEITKQEITKDDILRNQETNESEKKSVFGAKPTSGSLYPRPELERRPETGSKSFWSVMAFDGAAPETINGRLVIQFELQALPFVLELTFLYYNYIEHTHRCSECDPSWMRCSSHI